MRIQAIMEFPEKLPKPFLTLFGYLCVLAISVLDTFTSDDVSLSLLYLFPIILIAWYEGGLPATAISIFSAINWGMSDLLSGHVYSTFTVPTWNVIMMFGVFVIVAYSIATIKKLMNKEQAHAHTDDLTGIANIRFFYEQARIEIGRSTIDKQPFTLAYITINSLWHLNDTLGHITGDYLLHEVAQIIRLSARSTDIISRLGGAEFAILMPKTNNENATVIIYQVQEHLLDMVSKKGWPVTFSTGVVTCDGPTYTTSELIKMAKDLMNTTKEPGKNMVKSIVLDLSSTAS